MFRLSDLKIDGSLSADAAFGHLGVPDDATPGALVFCERLKFLNQANANENVSAVLVRAEDVEALSHSGKLRSDLGIVVTARPRVAYWRLHNLLVDQGVLGVAVEAGIGSNVRLHPSAQVSPTARIEDGVTLGPNVVVGDRCIVGAGSELAAGVVIGAEGMQAFHDDGRLARVRHAGSVRIGQGVSLFTNAVVSRAVRPVFTTVGDGSFISILVSVGHETILGRNCQLAGNVLVGGSVRMGDEVWVGPSATIKDGLRIGDGAQIKLGSVVVSDVPAGSVVSGNFAIPHGRNLLRHAREVQR